MIVLCSWQAHQCLHLIFIFPIQVRNPKLECNFDHGEVRTSRSPLKSMYSKRFHFLQLKLYTTVACYAVDGSWPAILAWRAVLKASISCMSVIEDGSLFQPCMVLGKNDILYTVTLVYGSKNFWDPRVLLSFDQTMDSASGISTKLCLILKSLASSGI